MRLLTLPALLAFACAPDKEDSGGNGSLGASADTGDCRGTAPTIEYFKVSEGDPVTPEGSDVPQPTILFMIEYEDEDGDAHVISLDMWFDDVVDGAVDMTGDAQTGFANSALQDADGNTVDECAGDGGTVEFSAGVTGTDFAYSKEYEFAAVLYDNADMASEVAIAVGTTPAELTQ